jgi:hypothetical protein
VFHKYSKGIEDTERVHIEIPKNTFLNEARDY